MERKAFAPKSDKPKILKGKPKNERILRNVQDNMINIKFIH